MEIKLNLDADLAAELAERLGTDREWFLNLPASVQLAKLAPFVEKQRRRDQKRFGVRLVA